MISNYTIDSPMISLDARLELVGEQPTVMTRHGSRFQATHFTIHANGPSIDYALTLPEPKRHEYLATFVRAASRPVYADGRSAGVAKVHVSIGDEIRRQYHDEIRALIDTVVTEWERVRP